MKIMKFKSKFSTNAIPFLGLILVIVVLQVASGGKLLVPNNVSTIVNEVFILMIGASAMVFLMAQGSLDLSMMANMAFSCAVAVKASYILPILALPVGIAVGLFFGLINGLINVKCKIDAFITTIGMSYIIGGLVAVLINDQTSLAAPYSMLKWDSTELRIAVLVIVMAVGYYMFEYSKFGRYSKAIGSCEEAARQSGVDVDKVKMLSFVYAGGICGLLAFFSILRTATAVATVASSTMFNILIAVLLGGVSITGGSNTKFRAVIIGSLTMAFLSVGMTICSVDTTIQQLIKGVIFLVIVFITYDRKGIAIIK